jgi:hypothetical protein
MEFLTKSFIKKPVPFKYNPHHYDPGPDTELNDLVVRFLKAFLKKI